MSGALDNRDRRAVEHLLTHCAALSAGPPKPVFDRLRERIGAELTRRLLYALAGVHRIRRLSP